MNDLDVLVKWFETVDCAMVALSGGVDSALVAHAAFVQLGGSSVAVTADYSTLSQEEMASAKSVCSEIGLRHILLKYDELENPDFVKNDNSRCYHCRTELGSRLTNLAKAMNGSWTIVDGTNIDDLGDYRPGIEAMRRYDVRSPLVEVGFTKADIRRVARAVGLSVHDRPSNSCLASRIPWGERITAQRLARVELGERIVKQITGARQVRVRDVGGFARIEVGRESLCLFADGSQNADAPAKQYGFGYVHNDKHGDEYVTSPSTAASSGLLNLLRERLVMLGFDGVEIDPNGYRPGKLNGTVSD